MTALEEALIRICSDLREINASFALVGGLAVSVHTEPRFTRDIDLAVLASNDTEAERITRDLCARGYRMSELLEQERTGLLATVRLLSPSSPPVPVDLLFASSGIEAEVVAAAKEVDILPGLPAPVASPEHLVALKVLARDDLDRPQDAADLRALLSRPGGIDEGQVRGALALIHSRGFSRRRDLERELLRAMGKAE